MFNSFMHFHPSRWLCSPYFHALRYRHIITRQTCTYNEVYMHPHFKARRANPNQSSSEHFKITFQYRSSPAQYELFLLFVGKRDHTSHLQPQQNACFNNYDNCHKHIGRDSTTILDHQAAWPGTRLCQSRCWQVCCNYAIIPAGFNGRQILPLVG